LNPCKAQGIKLCHIEIEVNSEEEDMEEARVALSDQKPSNVGHVEERSICQEDVLKSSASYIIKRGI